MLSKCYLGFKVKRFTASDLHWLLHSVLIGGPAHFLLWKPPNWAIDSWNDLGWKERSCRSNHPISNIVETCAWIFLSELQLTPVWGWLTSLLLWLSNQGLPLLWHLLMEKVTAQLRTWNGHSLESSVPHPTNTDWQVVTSGIQDRRHHGKHSYATKAQFRNVKRCCCQQEDTVNYKLKCTQ